MATTTAGAVNEAFYFITVFSVLLFFGIVFLMVYFAVRYRAARNPVATEIPGNAWLEVAWVVLPTILALAMFFYGLTGYRFLRSSVPGALEVAVHSRQWSWLFEYENGAKVPDLVLPSGRDVRLKLTSDDVLHAFYLPAYRVQVDTVPGMTTYANFKTGAIGSYDILCAQYCGTSHSAMLAKLHVLAPAAFAAWYAGGQVQLAGARIPAIKVSGTELLRQRGCVSCHSLDGSGMPGPTFKGMFGSRIEVRGAGGTRSVVVDGDFIRRSIVDPGADIAVGFQNIMPSGKDVFTAAELEEALSAIESLK